MDSSPADSFLSVLTDVCLVLDEDWAVVQWNRAALEQTGRDETAASGTTLSEWIAGTDVDRVREALEGLDDDETATVRAALRADTGTRPYECRLHRGIGASDELRYAVVGHRTDDRIGADNQQTEILDRMSDGFLAVDEDWEVTYVNDSGKRFVGEAMGLDPDDAIVGRHLWEGIPAAVDTRFYEHYQEAMSTQEPVSFESYFAPLEAWFDVRAYPSETGLSVYFTDITARKQQRDTLENRERVLRDMHEIISDRDRPFEAKVQSLLKLGRTELETDYGTLSEISGDEYVFDIVSAADDSIQPGDVVPLSATNCEIAAGTEQTLVLGDVARDAPAETDRAGYVDWGIECYIGAPVFLDDNVHGTFCFYDTAARADQFSEWEVTLVDLMSRWVSYELQRQTAKERLKQQNERLERFASIVSHDLRNPINVVDASLELLGDVDDSEHLDRCRRAVGRMDALIDDLLTLAQAGDVIDEPQPIALSTLVEQSLHDETDQAVTVEVVSDRTIRADTARLQQLFENLVQNAIDHGGTTVTVGTIEGGFFVEDDGPGISADKREQVFEHGFTTSASGTGFGLAIVEEISDAHGWTIEVTDAESGGARFEFTGVSGTFRTAQS